MYSTSSIPSLYDHDAQLKVFGISLAALVILFHIFAPFCKDVKRLSWILTTLSSLTMSLVSLPFLWDWFSNGASLKHVRALPELAVIANRFFQAYLVADLALGCIYYRSQITLLAGWIHHPLYVFIVELVVRKSWPHVFCLAGVMEVPTLVFGISTFLPRLRSNVFFALTFFLTRIAFHIILGVSFLFEENRNAVTGGSYIPAILLAGVLPLHLTWFVGCIKGFIRRARKASTTRPPASSSPYSPPEHRPTIIKPISFNASSVAASSTLPTPFRRLRHRFSHRRQSLERALRAFPYNHHILGPPTSKRRLISNAVSACIPRRETLYEWIGLGERRKRLFWTPPNVAVRND